MAFKRCFGLLSLLVILSCLHLSNYNAAAVSVVFMGRKQTASTDETVEDKKQNPSLRKGTRRRSFAINKVLINAGKRGLGGGIGGAIAGVVQVFCLMWLRTVMNYQCRYGTTFSQAFNVLYKEGGIARFYQGLIFALIQAPLSRFVSTAANDGVQALLSSFESTQSWGVGRSTIIASLFVGVWRMVLMPIDTCKVVLQVDGHEGFRSLLRRVKNGKFSILYQGAVANAVSSILGHYPWFYVYNVLSKNKDLLEIFPSQLLRNGMVGLAASIVSDTVVNSIRVVKTTKQSMGSKHELSYIETIRMVLAADGWKGLFGRGLRTRIFANALQSALFTIIWRGLADRWGQMGSASADQQNDKLEQKSGRTTDDVSKKIK
jgi:hypothetical protein